MDDIDDFNIIYNIILEKIKLKTINTMVVRFSYWLKKKSLHNYSALHARVIACVCVCVCVSERERGGALMRSSVEHQLPFLCISSSTTTR